MSLVTQPRGCTVASWLQRAATSENIAGIGTARRRPLQARSKETLAILVEAAAQVFSREGISATTNRIAERAGLSIGTLYQYFPDKGALLHAVAARHVRDADARLTALFEQLRVTAPSFEDTMDQVLHELVDLHAEHPRLHALLHRVATTAADLDEMRMFEDRLCAEVAYHLKRCDRGTIGASEATGYVDEDPELTARSIVALVDAQLHRVMPHHGYDIEQLRLTVARLAPARPAPPDGPPPPAG